MDILYFLQQHRTPLLDFFFTVCTYFGQDILIISLICFVYWCMNKKLAYKIFFTYCISGLLVQGLKITFRIQRPWILDSRLEPVSSAVSGATGYSFPSGHTQGATNFFASLALHYKKKSISIISFSIIFLVMLSRMYLGCHTLKDVLTSFVLTFLTAIAVNYGYEHFSTSDRTKLLIVIIGELFAFCIIGYGLYILQTNASTTILTMDCFKAAGAAIGFGIGWYAEQKWIHYDSEKPRSPLKKILILLVGLIITLVIKEGLKLIPGNDILLSIIRYALAVLWMISIYPYILIKKSL